MYSKETFGVSLSWQQGGMRVGGVVSGKREPEFQQLEMCHAVLYLAQFVEFFVKIFPWKAQVRNPYNLYRPRLFSKTLPKLQKCVKFMYINIYVQ